MRGWIFAAAMFAATAANAAPQWMTLPPTPTLPKADTSGYAPVNGIKLWYATFGQGEPVLFVHGGLGNSDYWGNQVRALAAAHYRVIVMDSRGHGRSTRNAQPYGYDLMSNDVIGLLDYLKLKKVALVGWSDGAIIGLDIAMHHPDRLSKLFAFAANIDPSASPMPRTARSSTNISRVRAANMPRCRRHRKNTNRFSRRSPRCGTASRIGRAPISQKSECRHGSSMLTTTR